MNFLGPPSEEHTRVPRSSAGTDCISRMPGFVLGIRLREVVRSVASHPGLCSHCCRPLWIRTLSVLKQSLPFKPVLAMKPGEIKLHRHSLPTIHCRNFHFPRHKHFAQITPPPPAICNSWERKKVVCHRSTSFLFGFANSGHFKLMESCATWVVSCDWFLSFSAIVSKCAQYCCLDHYSSFL